MAQSIPSVPIPPLPLGISQAFVIMSVLAVGICQKTSAWRWGICQFF